MIAGLNPGRIGTSAAGKRIWTAGAAYQRERQSATMAAEAAPPAGAAVAPRPKWTTPRIDGEHRCRFIIAATAVGHGISVREILSGARRRAVSAIRQEAIYRCLVATDYSLAAIGLVFRRDHTSIAYGGIRHAVRIGAPIPRGMRAESYHADRRRRRNA